MAGGGSLRFDYSMDLVYDRSWSILRPKSIPAKDMAAMLK